MGPFIFQFSEVNPEPFRLLGQMIISIGWFSFTLYTLYSSSILPAFLADLELMSVLDIIKEAKETIDYLLITHHLTHQT